MKISFQEIDLGLKKLWIIRNNKPVIDFNFNLHKKLGMCQHLIFLPHTPKNAITEFVFRNGLGIKYGHLSILPIEKKTTTR